MNDRKNKELNIKSCAECIPADMDCQVSVECKRQRREQRKEKGKPIINPPKGWYPGEIYTPNKENKT